MPQSQWIVLVVAASAAAIMLVRLFLVLGRRSGTETPIAQPAANGNPPARQTLPLPPAPDAPGLFDLQLADRSFDAAKFLKGACTAYGLIVTAFEKGDCDALKPLVSPEVLEGFTAAITARGTSPVAYRFAGVRQARIASAAVEGGQMEITVSFTAGFETPEAMGAAHEISDLWTFTRPVQSGDPNWTLVATSGEVQ